MCKSFGLNLAEKGPKIALAAAKKGDAKKLKSPNGESLQMGIKVPIVPSRLSPAAARKTDKDCPSKEDKHREGAWAKAP
jgi:hypothetical protein